MMYIILKDLSASATTATMFSTCQAHFPCFILGDATTMVTVTTAAS
jgi:hypothetical protein